MKTARFTVTIFDPTETGAYLRGAILLAVRAMLDSGVTVTFDGLEDAGQEE